MEDNKTFSHYENELNELHLKCSEDANIIHRNIGVLENTKTMLEAGKLTVESATSVILSLNNFEDIEDLSLESANDDSKGLLNKIIAFIKKLWNTFKSIMIKVYLKGMEIIRKIIALFKSKNIEVDETTELDPKVALRMFEMFNLLNVTQIANVQEMYTQYSYFLAYPYYLFDNINNWTNTIPERIDADRMYPMDNPVDFTSATKNKSIFYKNLFIGKNNYPHMDLFAKNPYKNMVPLCLNSKGTLYVIEKFIESGKENYAVTLQPTERNKTHFMINDMTIDMAIGLFKTIKILSTFDKSKMLGYINDDIASKFSKMLLKSNFSSNEQMQVVQKEVTAVGTTINKHLLGNIEDINNVCLSFLKVYWEAYSVKTNATEEVYAYVQSPDNDGTVFFAKNGENEEVNKYADQMEKFFKMGNNKKRPTFIKDGNYQITIDFHNQNDEGNRRREFLIAWTTGTSKELIMKTVSLIGITNEIDYSKLKK